MTLYMIAASAVACAAGAAYYRSFSFFPFAAGVLTAATANIVKTIMLERAVSHAVVMETEKAKNYLLLQQQLRLIPVVACLAAAVFAPFISLYGAVAGVLTIQISAYALKISETKRVKAEEERN